MEATSSFSSLSFQFRVSIHASVMEATRNRIKPRHTELVSIHASVMEATVTSQPSRQRFQTFRSTPP